MCAACTAAPLSILTVSNPTSSEEEAAASLPRHNPYNYNFSKSFKNGTMKKIMFNDQYGLTEAVLTGVKTMTRRPVLKMCKAIQELRIKDGHCEARYGQVWFPHKGPNYNVGEIVAVAQSYHKLNKQGYLAPEWLDHTCEDSAGYDNKMFVRADLMPYGIKITDIKVERLRDISIEDCIKEGIQEFASCSECGGPIYTLPEPNDDKCYFHPREAFEALINGVCPRLTWESNPWVFVYSFKLIQY